MDPTILMSFPAAGTSVGANFTTDGSVSPPGSAVTVKLWNNANSYGPFNATVQSGEWSYQFQNIAAGTGYSVQACVSGTCDQHNNITVE